MLVGQGKNMLFRLKNEESYYIRIDKNINLLHLHTTFSSTFVYRLQRQPRSQVQLDT